MRVMHLDNPVKHRKGAKEGNCLLLLDRFFQPYMHEKGD